MVFKFVIGEMGMEEIRLHNFLTLIDCCMKSIAISISNSSSATRVNLLTMELALK